MMNFIRSHARTAALAGLLAGALASYGIAQGVLGIFQAGLPSGPSVFSVNNGTVGIYWGASPRIGVTGHLETGVPAAGMVPVLSACGGAVAGDAGSTDTAGTVTQGGTVTTCTITFGTAFVAAPMCVVSDLTGTRASMATAITNTAIAVTGITASDKLSWFCVARSGG